MSNLAAELIAVFRQNVEALLAKKGWTRGILAEQMAVTPSYVTQVLGGHRGVGLDAVQKFATALGVKPHDLIRERVKQSA